MRTLVVSAVYPPSKIAEADHVLHICRTLSERGIDVHLLTRNLPNLADTSFVTLHPVMNTWGWRESIRVIKTIKTVSPDAVLLFFLGTLYNYKLMITFLGTILRLFFRGTAFAVMFSNVGTAKGLGSMGQHLAKWVGKYKYGTLLSTSDRIIVGTENHAQKLFALSPAITEKVDVVPPPPIINVSPLPPEKAILLGRERLGVSLEACLIAYFGRIYPGKGIETLFAAFGNVAHEIPDARLAMIGGFLDSDYWVMRASYSEELNAEVRCLGIEDKVVWTGEYAWDSDTPSLCLRAADICVLPFDDGVSLQNSSLACAATHGLPIIAARGKSLEAPLEHGVNGLFFPMKDSDALSEAIRELIKNPELQERLRQGALTLARKCFSWESATDATIAALNGAPWRRPRCRQDNRAAS